MGEDFERRLERNKDLAQEVVETVARRVGTIADIITGAVADVAHEIGEAVTDGFEMRDAARRSKADDARTVDSEIVPPAQLDAAEDDENRE